MPRNARSFLSVFARFLGLAVAATSVDFAIVMPALEFLPETGGTLADMRRVMRARFRLTNLPLIGHNAHAGIAGKELNP